MPKWVGKPSPVVETFAEGFLREAMKTDRRGRRSLQWRVNPFRAAEIFAKENKPATGDTLSQTTVETIHQTCGGVILCCKTVIAVNSITPATGMATLSTTAKGG